MKLLASAILVSLAVAAAVVPTFIFQDKAGQIEPQTAVSLTPEQAVRRIETLPVRFEPAAGRESAFLGRGFGYTIFLTPGGAAVSPEKDTAQSFRMQLVGGNLQAAGSGAGQLAGVSNYLLGGDRAAWRTNVQNFTAVRYSGVYPGVDLLYYGKQRELEYDFIVAPRARHDVIGMRFEGAEIQELTAAGDLRLRVGKREAALRKPIAYQESNGTRTEVACNFVLRENGEVGFEVGAYNASLPLVIDPVLSYSTFLGGTGDEQITSVTLDSSANIYVTGFTDSNANSFPVTGGVQNNNAGGYDIFVTKLNSSGSAIVYSTYLGGAGDDRGYGIAVDSNGSAYITGLTHSDGLATGGAAQTTRGGASDAYVAKLNASGSAIIYFTYVGGSSTDTGQGIAVNSSGEAIVAGGTQSSNFPTNNASQSSRSGSEDAFLTKINAGGSSRVFSTYFGGGAVDQAFDVTVDGNGNSYIAGTTSSNNLPTSNPLQSSFGGGVSDAFVAKFTSSGSVSYATYLGGGNGDGAEAIAVDGSGNAYVTGFTTSQDFRRVNAFQSSFGGNGPAGFGDAFVTKISASGNTAIYSTYLGGNSDEAGFDIAVDGTGRAVVVGGTASGNFPVSNPFQGSLNGGGSDAYVAMLDAGGNSLVYSSFLGGGSGDTAWAVHVTSSGTAYVAGQTASSNLANIGGVQNYRGLLDGFIARVEPTGGGGGSAPFQLSVTPNTMTVTRGSAASYTVNVTSVGGPFNSAVNLACLSLPTGASCTFTPTSVTPGAAGATATLSIRTTAPAAIPPVRPIGPNSPMPLLWLLAALFALALATAYAQRRQLRWRLLPSTALLFVIALALGAQVSCGGGSGGSGGGGGGGGQGATAPGTYTVGVMGTSGGMQASTNVTLVVQ